MINEIYHILDDSAIGICDNERYNDEKIESRMSSVDRHIPTGRPIMASYEQEINGGGAGNRTPVRRYYT